MAQIPNNRHLIYFHGTESDALEVIKKTGLSGVQSGASAKSFGFHPGTIWLTDGIDTAHGFAGRALENKAELQVGFDPFDETLSFEEQIQQDNELRRAKATLKIALLRVRIPELCDVEVTHPFEGRAEEFRKLTKCDIKPEDIEVCFDPKPKVLIPYDPAAPPRTAADNAKAAVESDSHWERV